MTRSKRHALRLASAVLLTATSLFSGCKPAAPEPAAEAPAEAVAEPAAPDSRPGTPPPKKPAAAPVKLPPLAEGPAEIWKEFSGAKALESVARQIEIGPRPFGSPAIEKARALIEAALKANGWEVERESFTDETPRGPITFVNLIGRYLPPKLKNAPTHTQRAIVCSHYDTKRFSTIAFLGANDAGSSTGALIELSRVLSLAPALAIQVELVFFDGEEALVQFTAPDDPKPDGLYGSRYYARTLRESGRARQFKFGILWDMIGDKDFGITLPPDSPQQLTREILADADALGIREKFGYLDRALLDDHVPLNSVAQIPTIDLIDFDYLYWHTADDTLERLGPEGLQHVGAVTLRRLRFGLKP